MLLPLMAPAFLLITRRSLALQVYGAFLFLLLSPVVASRLLRRRRVLARLRAQFEPDAAAAAPAAEAPAEEVAADEAPAEEAAAEEAPAEEETAAE